MLVETMNFTEIRNEIIKDLPKVQVKINYLMKDYIKKCRKVKKPDGYKIYVSYKSLRGNNYTMRLIYYKDDKQSFFEYWVNFINDESELTIVIPSELYESKLANSNTLLPIYTGHFFERYNERMNLNLKKVKDIKEAYFENTDIIGVIDGADGEYVDDENTVLEVRFIVEGGIGLGFLNEKDKFLILNTFISDNEFKGKDSERSVIGLEEILNYEDLIKTIYS